MKCIAIAPALLALAMCASAQVHRCIDAAGKATYSDVACPTNSKKAERVLDADATDRRYDPYASQRTMDSMQRATAISRSMSDDSISRAQVNTGDGAGIIDSDPNQRIREQDERTMNRKMAEIEAGQRAQNEQVSRAERARRQAAATPPHQVQRKLTNCSGAYCYDNQGGSYSQGVGNELQRNDGATCSDPTGSGKYRCR